MSTAQFEGILPAIITPFDENENFAPAVFERLLERLYATGIAGLYVNGQTGEGLLQPVEQRKRVAEVALRSSPSGKTVIVHVGAYRTADALDLARHAASIGAQAIASLPPLGAYSFAEIRAYYQALAAVSDLPVLVYYFPAICPAIQGTPQALELLDIPNVIGLKFTDFDLYKLSQIKRSRCVVFNGHDEVLIAGLLMGADGGIGSFYNLVPELFVEVFSRVQQGQWEKAQCVQWRINELVEIGLRFPLVPAIKTILRWQGLDCGEALAPRRRLTDEENGRLRDLLDNSSFEHLTSAVAQAR
jgi:N-acetylneuraminate lyase